jgi:ParB-like chromosome segregation protein Spo0J
LFRCRDFIGGNFSITMVVRLSESRRSAMTDWPEGEIRWIAIETIGERYRRYRLPDATAEAAMAGSLGRYGQVSPLAVCLREERPEVLDGFKRLAAAKTLPGVLSLQARLLVVDERTAKAIILGLNGIGGRMKELEEAWIVQALVREDGLSQLQVAELLGRHKSWVCRRLALLERLSEECREDLRLGLLSPTMARQLTRLPAGNQIEVVGVAHREHLTAAEMHGVVEAPARRFSPVGGTASPFRTPARGVTGFDASRPPSFACTEARFPAAQQSLIGA